MGFVKEKGKEKSPPYEEVAPVLPELSDQLCFTETDGVITTTMMDLPGYRVVKVLGTVFGISVRSRNIAASLGMVLKSFAGGELGWFTNMLYSCRNDSMTRVVEECKRRGGNAIITLRFDAGDMGGFAQTAAYGTACIVEKVDDAVATPTQLEKAT
ncbi:UPF0145 domain-containing protein [Drechmeria coniospora]|uniref:UPF0145 domain-containing protein n=1 Tax=Drechmeria coniospora TaxID=98403 RepID=A0A151GIR9_DRECN|nr:UPF0145 domain-containing protein [Drechmeria coniospora]KYK56922.1 UPF0145 domain-containing protein [Drechmeria coniospora]ODA80392.1 hypothetical protein RJ55_03350 [Drechmeria coniospora]